MSAANHHARRITVLHLGREVSATSLTREHARRRASTTGDRPPTVDDPEHAVDDRELSEVGALAPIAATLREQITRLRSVQLDTADRARPHGSLERAIDRLDEAVHELTACQARVPESVSRARDLAATDRAPPATQDEALNEAAFVAWVRRSRRPDLQDPEHRTASGEPSLVHLLEAVCGSSQELPADAARKLGVAPGTTVGTAASDILSAVRDPSGPRCTSYPAALFHLADEADLRNEPSEPRERSGRRSSGSPTRPMVPKAAHAPTHAGRGRR